MQRGFPDVFHVPDVFQPILENTGGFLRLYRSGQIIATFLVGWSAQMGVRFIGIFPPNTIKSASGITPPEIDMEPENYGFQKESPFLGTSFQVPC